MKNKSVNMKKLIATPFLFCLSLFTFQVPSARKRGCTYPRQRNGKKGKHRTSSKYDLSAGQPAQRLESKELY